jgi:hypothetical protein
MSHPEEEYPETYVEDDQPPVTHTGPVVRGSADAPRPILHARSRRKAQVNPLALTIETGRHPPDVGLRVSQSKWLPLLRKMHPGESVFVEDTTPNKLGYVRRLAKSIEVEVLLEPEGSGVRIFVMGPDAPAQNGEVDEDGL